MNVNEKTPLLSSEKIDRTSLDESAMSDPGTELCRPPRRLGRVRKLAYGVGHVFNDMAASMWFTYLILFYHKVVQLDNALAGTLLLIGQIVDGLATPVIGYLCDITPFWYLGFGRRKIWHLLGTILVAVSLFFFWHECLPCQVTHASLGWQILWYSAFIAVFQVGWASVQISHLSLIPELTDDENERVGLNAIRSETTSPLNLSILLLPVIAVLPLLHVCTTLPYPPYVSTAERTVFPLLSNPPCTYCLKNCLHYSL